jgi:cation diffusion facilitator CzcD-associated flavoprotein CzcO
MIHTTSYFINRGTRSLHASVNSVNQSGPEPAWSHFYATRPEIATYYTDFAKHYRLDRCTQFRSFVASCEWDDDAMIWHVSVHNAASKAIELWTADFVCQCVGSLDRPKFGTTPGRENFRGISWHTAHWRDDEDLSGKRVGIIGCGPSAAQIIPEIVDKVEHLTVYMRTPPVCVPRNDFAYSKCVLLACYGRCRSEDGQCRLFRFAL